ncbi:MAG: DNA replication/repair protein RecF [Hyphomicrobiales bacterium]|nr:DNA replication/repair protein RecF [Hyphomicrobiales bacterium]
MRAGLLAGRETVEGATVDGRGPRIWIERLRLTDFRNYAGLAIELDERPVVLTGANGAGKTNLLEAVSLLAPGRGLRGAPFGEIVREGAAGGWAVAARVNGADGPVDLGTGYAAAPGTETAGRTVRVDGTPARSSGALGDHVRLVWLTPAMDGLFTGPASERRRFLDRLIQTVDPGYRTLLGRFERAMRQRNRLLEAEHGAPAQFEGLEAQMAETGVAVAAARRDALGRLLACIETRREADAASSFPWATLALAGVLEERLAHEAAVDVEDAYGAMLAAGRPRDRAAKRTLEGPHRSDLLVGHGPRGMAARKCSTGEQKALLVGLVLAHSELVAQSHDGEAPLILLDEIAAHLDASRRTALFREIGRLGVQAWMTGTDRAVFVSEALEARLLSVEDGGICP